MKKMEKNSEKRVKMVKKTSINKELSKIQKKLPANTSANTIVKRDMSLKYPKGNDGLTDKKSHLIEYVKNVVGIESENEMFLLGGYIKEFEMILDIKDTVETITSSTTKKKLVFNKEEFIEYINNDNDDF